MINRSQLKFHETFQPEANYITSILELAEINFRGTKFEISDETGIPTGKQKGKVEPSIKYAAFMGLISFDLEKGVYSLRLTDLGGEVFAQDKYLHEDLTKWLCHYGISRPNLGAAQWAYISHDTHCGYTQSVSSEHVLKKANQEFELNISFEEMFGVVKRSYMDGFFSSLNYLEWDETLSFTEHMEAPELTYVYAYALFDSWDHLLPSRHEITMTEIEEVLGLGKVFGLPPGELTCVLDSLVDEGLVIVNRQLFPASVVRTAETKELISDLYSRLL